MSLFQQTAKVALSHDWLNGMRGGEKCLEILCDLYPQAPIYTLFYEKEKVSDRIRRHRIVPSWLRRFPSVFTRYRYYLPFYGAAIRSFNLKKYDLILSTSHCVAKGVRKNKKALHICYCFTPARYAWGFFDEYFGGMNWFSRILIRRTLKRFRKWDLKSNDFVDHFVAISRHVQERIRRCYRRESEVIYPPVDTVYYTPDGVTLRNDDYLVISALVPYKRIELAVRVFNRLGRKLVIIGDGPDRKKLQATAKKNIRFLGWQADSVLRDHYRRSRALIFPGEEDFGIVPVEAQACGCPVIAYGRGGALETVLENETGIFFQEAKEKALAEAIQRFEYASWIPEYARKNAERFSKERFQMEIKSMIQQQLGARKTRRT
jgi:glycosyltransferase involved in cell wall biosynthesis